MRTLDSLLSLPWASLGTGRLTIWSAADRSGRVHVLDDCTGEISGTDFGRARHEALEIVGHALLPNGTLNAGLDQAANVLPAHKIEHHHTREHHRTGIDDVL